MYVKPDYDPINPGEQEWFGMDFSKLLRDGETITSFSVDVTLEAGADDAPADRVIGMPSLNGTIVSQLIGNCVASSYYIICFTVSTNQGQTLKEFGKLQCNPVD